MLARITPLVAALATFSLPATAQVFDPMAEPVRAEILPGWELPDGRRMAGLRLILEDGWKTYWRTPGDAGIPPLFDWRRAQNVSGVAVSWPAPQVFYEYGMRSLGYKQSITLPITIAPETADAPIRLRGRMMLGVCSEVCMPFQLHFDEELAPPASKPTPQIVAALASVPYSASEAGVQGATCVIRPSDHGMQIEAHVNLPHTGGEEVAVIETDRPEVWVSEPKAQRNGDTLVATSEMVQPDGGAFSVDRSDVRITVIGANYAVDVQGCTG